MFKLLGVVFFVNVYIIACSQTDIFDVESDLSLSNSIQKQLAQYDIISVGEIHGTNEITKLVSNLVKVLAESNENVILGLEIKQSEQSKLNSVKNYDELKGVEHFKLFRDGRTSKAMADLILIANSYVNVKIVCFDQNYPSYNISRDSAMAMTLDFGIKDYSTSKVILLGGNIHTSLDVLYGNLSPMLYIYQKYFDSNKKILSLNVTYQGGTAWCCPYDSGECGINEFENNTYGFVTRTDNYIRISKDYLPRFNGEIHLEKITASPPLCE